MSDGRQGGYLIEFIQVGNAVKVSAVDPKTGLEVSIVGSPLMSRDQLSRAAVQKLEYRLSKAQK
ncbi:MAG: hypothetical protein H3C28_08270 [Sphingomonadales bacterium]|nr:hypothetical protein [Sphingomonadales bacterium]